jgi:hypothetical protein
MTGKVQIGRWTLAYFAVALGFLLAAEAALVAGIGGPHLAWTAPDNLAVTHLVTLGWLSIVLCGALTQFVPVLLARPLACPSWPLPALLCLAAGTALLGAGFCQLGRGGSLPLLPTAALLLALGFALVLGNLAATLWQARPLPLPARLVGLGLAAGAATVALGVVFALALDGRLGGVALRLTADGLPLHIAAGLGGWLTVSAAGVSYRLLAMFMLAPDVDGRGSRLAWIAAAAALAGLAVGGPLLIAAGRAPAPVLGLAAVLPLPALALYGRDMRALYRRRQRRALELHSRMAAVALAHLGLTALLGLGLALSGRLAAQAGAVVLLAGFGWLSGLVLAMLPKIIAFLTWLGCYGPLLGRQPVPRVQDLVVEARCARWFALYYAAVWALVVGFAIVAPVLFRTAALALLIATLGLAGECLRTRRLADVPRPLRPRAAT